MSDTWRIARTRVGEIERSRPRWTKATWGERVLSEACEEMGGETEGGRNNLLYGKAFYLSAWVRDGGLTREQVIEGLTAAAERAGLDKAEIPGTLLRGLTTGLRETERAFYPASIGEGDGAIVAPPKPRPSVRPAPQPSTARGTPGERIALLECPHWGVSGGVIHRVSWGELVEQVRNPRPPPPGVPLSPAAMPDEVKKRSALWVPGDWPEAARSEGAKPHSVSLLCLDYDDGSTIDQIAEWWKAWTYVAHTTANHNRAKGSGGERWHVIVPLSRPVSVDELRRLKTWTLHPRNTVGKPDKSATARIGGYGAPVRWGADYSCRVNEARLLDPDEALGWLTRWGDEDELDTWKAEHPDQRATALEGLHVRDAVARWLDQLRRAGSAGPYIPLPGGRVDPPAGPKLDELPTEALLPPSEGCLPDWNELWRLIGPWRPDRVVVLVGPTGRGKSAMAVQAAEAAARRWPSLPDGWPVLYVSAEMGTDELVARMVALRSALSVTAALSSGPALAWSDLLTGAVPVDRLELACKALVSDCPSLYLWAPEGARRNGEALLEVAQEVSEAHGGKPPVVVLDYLQRFAPSAGDRDEAGARRIDVAELSQALRDLSRPRGLSPHWPGASVLALSTTARTHYPKVFDCAALLIAHEGGMDPKGKPIPPEPLEGLGKESGELEADATVVMVMTTNPAPNKASDQARRAPRDASVVVAKNRSGSTGRVPMTFHPVSGIFQGVTATASGGKVKL